MLYLLTSYVLDLCAALVFGIHILIFAARFGTAANLGTLTDGFASVQFDNTMVCSWSPLLLNGKTSFKKTSMACSIMVASENVRQLYHAGRIADPPSDQKTKNMPCKVLNSSRLVRKGSNKTRSYICKLEQQQLLACSRFAWSFWRTVDFV